MSEAGRGTTRWGVVILLTLTGSLATAHIYKLAMAMPVIRSDLGLGLVAGGWLFSMVNLLALLFGIAAGTVSDQIGHRRVILIGLTIMGAASVAGSFATSAAELLVSRFFEGVGFLGIVVAAPSLITAEARPKDQALAFGFWGGYHPAGGALLMISAPLILATLGWRDLWQVTGALSILFIVLILGARLRPPDHGDTAKGSLLTNVVRTTSSRGPWLSALSFGFYTMQFTALMGWLPTYLVEDRGLTTAMAGALVAVVIAVNVPGCLIGGVMLRRGWSHGGLVALTSVLMIAMNILIFSPALPDGVRYAACVGLSLVGGMIPTSVMASVPVVAPSPRQIGTTYGLIVQGANIGNVLGPPLLAAITTIRGRWEDALWMFLAFALLNLAMSFLLRQEEARRASRQTQA